MRFRRRDMRLAGYTSAVALCMTFFKQVRKLVTQELKMAIQVLRQVMQVP